MCCVVQRHKSKNINNPIYVVYTMAENSKTEM